MTVEPGCVRFPGLFFSMFWGRAVGSGPFFVREGRWQDDHALELNRDFIVNDGLGLSSGDCEVYDRSNKLHIEVIHDLVAAGNGMAIWRCGFQCR